MADFVQLYQQGETMRKLFKKEKKTHFCDLPYVLLPSFPFFSQG